MGGGASIPETMNKAQAQEIASDKWEASYDKLFDKTAVGGEITKEQFLMAMPLQVMTKRKDMFKHMAIHAPKDKVAIQRATMVRRTTAVGNAGAGAGPPKRNAGQAAVTTMDAMGEEDEEETEDTVYVEAEKMASNINEQMDYFEVRSRAIYMGCL